MLFFSWYSTRALKIYLKLYCFGGRQSTGVGMSLPSLNLDTSYIFKPKSNLLPANFNRSSAADVKD